MPFMPLLPINILCFPPYASQLFPTSPISLSNRSPLSILPSPWPPQPASLRLSFPDYPPSTTTHYTTAYRPRHNHHNCHNHHHHICPHFKTTPPRYRTATAPRCAYRLDTSVDDTCGGSCARDLGLLRPDARLECLDRVPVLLESGGELLILLYEHELGWAVGKGAG